MRSRTRRQWRSQYDTGDYEAHLDKALQLADYAGFPGARAEAEARGKLPRHRPFLLHRGLRHRALGRGRLARLRRRACGNRPRSASAPPASVQVFTGAHTHGQGHETTFAQLVADKLGVPIDNIEVVHGDTEKTPVGMGTYGSRSLAVGGSAIVKAAEKIVAKGKKIAAHLLEASRGRHRVQGRQVHASRAPTGRRRIGEMVFDGLRAASTIPRGRSSRAWRRRPSTTRPTSPIPRAPTSARWRSTRTPGWSNRGRSSRSTTSARVINPMIVEGQVHGGIAQGIGQALLEHCVYDESGQLLTGIVHGLLHAARRRPAELQGRRLTETPCTHNTLGRQGLRRGRRDRRRRRR